ncbi:hypothetical protein ABZ471_48565 [Streptomyces sp. NPDC005728]|uniref:hypothetical protein n=1 Tax=Streptomyces sp. NPDC005728 TaxID=3157054 RepID=UPI0033F08B62
MGFRPSLSLSLSLSLSWTSAAKTPTTRDSPFASVRSGLTLYQILDTIQDLLNCWTGTCTTCHRPLPRTSTTSQNPRARTT